MKTITWAAALVLAGSLTGCSSSGAPAVVTVTATPAPASSSVSSSTTTSSAASTAASASSTSAAASGSASGSVPASSAAAEGTSAADAKGAAAVQKALVAKGYQIPATGTMDAATTSAVKSFQRDNGLAATGEADDAFWEAVKGAGSGATGAQAGGVVTGSAQAGGVATAGGTSAQQPQAQPQSGANDCTALFAQWDAAVASGARGSRATAQEAHDLAMSEGCNPNKWLPSSMTKVYDPGTHRQGQSCSMSEIAHYDGAGLVCTQDVEGSPHWN